MIRPSSLPALKQCACFESGSSEYQEDGTQRHKALTELFSGDDFRLSTLEDDQAEAVRWADEYIRAHAPMSDHPIDFEKTLEMFDADLNSIKGTPDVVCGNHLFDLKWRYRDYVPQMAAYVMMMYQASPNREFVTVHLLFGATRKSETFKLDYQSACEIVEPIIDKARDEKREPTPCDYCHWCAKHLTCLAFKQRVDSVIQDRPDWKLETFESSFITDGTEMAKALRLARRLKKWCEGVEFRAKELWLKEGVQIPGFELKERQSKQFVTDVTEAFSRSGLPQAEFLKCCDLRLNTSKKYPEKVGIIDAYAKQTEISKAGAKRELLKKLDPVLKRGNPTQSLVDTKQEDTEEDSE